MLLAPRSALLLTTVSLAAGLFVAPGAAYAADMIINLTQEQMAAELKKVASTSTAAAENGWKATLSGVGDLDTSTSYVVDPTHGRALEQSRYGKDLIDTRLAVAGKGVYYSTTDPTSRSTVKMMGRPTVRYVFTAQPSLNLTTYLENTPTPAAMLTEDIQAGTKTTHDNGSADYTFSNGGERLTVRVADTGTLNQVQISLKDFTVKVSYAYGPQNVTLPSPKITMDSATFDRGRAYLDMPRSVAAVANDGAAAARQAAKGRTVTVNSVRKHVRRQATTFNADTGVKMVKVGDIRGGARVSATNPWTGKTVDYTVKASGRKVTVRG
ncbi:hypothetical protein [Actinoplanes xinjiangensis]|uniref:hypothetical protein n=1 Tax=Actinoplanes xinjiangensis TaxID=512350 RepID=UPI0034339908